MPPDRPVTVVVCHGDGCDQAEAVVGALRECIRGRPHGVLVAAGCPLGRLGCHARRTSGTRAPGAMLVVQPCSTDREPTGPAVLIGPVPAEDAGHVRAWLEGDDLRPGRLPARLRQPIAPRGVN